MDIVCVYDTGTTDTAQDLGEDINGNLTPREVTTSSERNGHRGIDMTTRHTAGNPDAEGRAFITSLTVNTRSTRISYTSLPTAQLKLIER